MRMQCSGAQPNSMMRSSQTITLFGEVPPSSQGPSGFLISTLLHGVAIISLYAGLKHMPKVVDPLSQRYTVRILNLHRQAPKIELASLKGVTRPTLKAASHTVARGGGHPLAPSGSRHVAEMIPAPQTLVQPDLPPDIVLPQETPIPLAVMWSTENSPALKIIPPPSQEVTQANVRPSLDTPNQEPKLADVRISSTAFVTDMPWPTPSTTSPITVRNPEAVNQVPQTSSQPVAPPIPARVMSLSDLVLQT